MSLSASTIIVDIILVATSIAIIRFVVKIHRNDPTAWAGAMRRFASRDRRNGIPSNVIVFAGSSSIRFWKTLTHDMAPLPVLNRGFGGSQIHDVTYYADQAVLRYKPRSVVFYAGENDMVGLFFSKKKTPEQVRDAFLVFCKKIHASEPNTPIYFISIKPPKLRIAQWPKMRIANQLIHDDCAADKRLQFIDIVPSMSDAAGNPRRDLYSWDGIHMNAKGYAIWTSIIKPVLVGSLDENERA